MGETAADVQREIVRLREETDLLVSELESRIKDATNVRAQVQRHPAIAAGAGLALLSGLAFAGYATYERVQAGKKPKAQLKHRISEIEESLGRKGKELRPTPRFKIEGRSREGMLKRLLYSAMTAMMVALAIFLARRAAATIWSKTMEERPPTQECE